MSERDEQAAIVDLLRYVGARVYVIGTVRRRGDYPGTMQSPGLPDLVAFVPHGARVEQVWIEVKAPGGRLRPAQGEFQAVCHKAGVSHVVGGIDVVLAWLRTRGAVKYATPTTTT